MRRPLKSKAKTPDSYQNDDELIVIKDISTGKDFYLMVIDNFSYKRREYYVMYNYVPDDGNHSKPELVIMRTSFTEKNKQCFYSIKDSRELEEVFSYFMDRYYNSPSPTKSDRRGIDFGRGDRIL